MGIFGSILKFGRLRRLSRILGAQLDASDFLKSLASNQPGQRDQALEELLDLCETDSILSAVLTRNNADRGRVRDAYYTLLHFGGGQWAGGFWLPVAVLGSPFTLDFLLREEGRTEGDMITVLLLEYFERHDRGPVRMELRGPMAGDPLRAIWDLEQRSKK
jgi:hypothetical protein